MKYEATKRKPEEAKARHIRVPRKNAATKPERDNPATRIGDPKPNIKALARSADSQVGADDFTSSIACCTDLGSTLLIDA